MHPETLAFLEGLFGRCQMPEQTYLTLTALPPAGSCGPTPSRHIQVGDGPALHDALERLLIANQHGWSAFVGIGLRTGNLGRWRRGGLHDVVALPALFADVDRPLQAIPQLTAFPLQASCIVNSGHGVHLYWLLHEPTSNLQLAGSLLQQLAVHFHGDSLSAAQSMRLVGGINYKRVPPTPCTLLELHSERRYNIQQFQQCLPARQRKASPVRPLSVFSKYPDDQRLVEAITQTLYREYQAFQKPNGWIAALCPLPHQRDYPGSHFSWNPTLRMGHCFGKHGRLLLRDLRSLLHL